MHALRTALTFAEPFDATAGLQTRGMVYVGYDIIYGDFAFRALVVIFLICV